MIKYIENGNLFQSGTDALINPVNCKGVMGKGIALEFKKRLPECVQPYKEACATGKLIPGTLLFVRLIVQPDLFGSKRPGVILFPTKNHWRDKSRIEWIEQGLDYLKNNYTRWEVKTIAMPQIGCGLGGLGWESVKPLIEHFLSEEPIEVEVYLRAIYDYKEKPSLGSIEKYYFAYGSNMDQAQMAERCSKAVFVSAAKISGHRFIINNRGVATIVPERAKEVHGILWTITDECEKSLDKYEGVNWGAYEKMMIDVETPSGQLVKALIYTARDNIVGSSREGYVEKIVKAAHQHGLAERYVEELRSWVKTNET